MSRPLAPSNIQPLLDPWQLPLAEAFAHNRAQTLALVQQWPHPMLCQQAHPDLSPIGWHWGHIAFTEALWLLDPGHPCLASQYRRWFAADGGPKTQRQHLPPTAELLAYSHWTRQEVAPRLRDGSPQDRLLRWLLQHEAQHRETMIWVAMLHQQPRWSLAEVLALEPLPGHGMIYIPPGETPLGSDRPEALDNERPAHWVRVPGFWLDPLPVTAGQYAHFLRQGGYDDRRWWSDAGWQWRQCHGDPIPLYWQGNPHHPVCGVNAYEAEAYACFVGKRLPSETEWEYAARLGNPYPWGRSPADGQRANFAGLQGGTTPVGHYPQGRNLYGIGDLLGNVWEWTATPFGPYQGFTSFPYAGYSAAYFDERHWVLKGGSWASSGAVLRSSFRNWYDPTARYPLVGFRCARDETHS